MLNQCCFHVRLTSKAVGQQHCLNVSRLPGTALIPHVLILWCSDPIPRWFRLSLIPGQRSFMVICHVCFMKSRRKKVKKEADSYSVRRIYKMEAPRSFPVSATIVRPTFERITNIFVKTKMEVISLRSLLFSHFFEHSLILKKIVCNMTCV